MIYVRATSGLARDSLCGFLGLSIAYDNRGGAGRLRKSHQGSPTRMNAAQ
jgi:hypothetical protein